MAWSVSLIVVGLLVAIAASRVVVDRAATLVAHTTLPPFMVGALLLALGTDLPEIANSVTASLAGHGDINVGDSIGSTVTQATLILALLPLVGGAFSPERRRMIGVGASTAVALGLGAVLMADGRLGRLDGAVLLVAWVVASLVLWRVTPPEQMPLPVEMRPRRTLTLLEAIGGLTVVTGGAYAAVRGFAGLAAELALPEYVVSFFLASIGTSLPELIVDASALRRGEREMAVGGLLGASLLDATISIGAGPTVAPTAVTASLALRGSLGALVVIIAVTGVLAWRRRHDWRTSLLFVGLYALFFPLLVGA